MADAGFRADDNYQGAGGSGLPAFDAMDLFESGYLSGSGGHGADEGDRAENLNACIGADAPDRTDEDYIVDATSYILAARVAAPDQLESYRRDVRAVVNEVCARGGTNAVVAMFQAVQNRINSGASGDRLELSWETIDGDVRLQYSLRSPGTRGAVIQDRIVILAA